MYRAVSREWNNTVEYHITKQFETFTVRDTGYDCEGPGEEEEEASRLSINTEQE
jgi:hypothetical protein